jgi:hypothetical protein
VMLNKGDEYITLETSSKALLTNVCTYGQYDIIYAL